MMTREQATKIVNAILVDAMQKYDEVAVNATIKAFMEVENYEDWKDKIKK